MLYSTYAQAALEPQKDGTLPVMVYRIVADGQQVFTPNHGETMDAAMRVGRWAAVNGSITITQVVVEAVSPITAY